MIEAVRPVSGSTQPAAVPAAPRTAPAAPTSAIHKADSFTRVDPGQLKTDKQIRAALAPAFAILRKQGFGDVVAALDKARFKVTGGTFGSTEYYAATSFTNTVSLAKDNFFNLGPKGQAGVLLHESIHVRQSRAYRAAATINQGYGLAPFKRNFAEMDAYKAQWAGMPKLGIGPSGEDSEIYWEAQTVLSEAGLIPKQ